MPQARLLDVMRDRIRVRHFSHQTETVYLGWARRFIRFHGGRHPREMSGPEVTQFLSYLAVERKVSASTQNQALSAILFLYKEVLEVELPWLDGVVRAKDLDFDYRQITVRNGKGAKDRHAMLPDSLQRAVKRGVRAADVV